MATPQAASSTTATSITQSTPTPIHGTAGEIYRTQRLEVNIVHAQCGDGMSEPEWVTTAEREHVECDGADGAAHAELAAPLSQSYAGLARYWRKRDEAS